MKILKEFIDSEEFSLTYLTNRIDIVNYKSIIRINDKEMIISFIKGKIIIIGINLSLRKLLDKEILITGDIYNIGVSYE